MIHTILVVLIFQFRKNDDWVPYEQMGYVLREQSVKTCDGNIRSEAADGVHMGLP